MLLCHIGMGMDGGGGTSCWVFFFSFFFKNVKLGGWIIQYTWKLCWLLLTVSYLVAGTHKQNYTLTTPAGSRGSKNERPNSTHLNLRGTQMSPLFSFFFSTPPLFSNLLLHLPLELSGPPLPRIPPRPLHRVVRRGVWAAIPLVSRRRLCAAGGGEERLRGPCKKKTKKKNILFARFYTQCTFPDMPAEVVSRVQGGREGKDPGWFRGVRDSC